MSNKFRFTFTNVTIPQEIKGVWNVVVVTLVFM